MSDGRRDDEEGVRGDTEAERDADETDSTPLSDLAAEVRARDDDVDEDVFENVEVGSLDGEALWDAVVDERADPVDVPPASGSDVDGGAADTAGAADADGTATDVDDPDESTATAGHVVDKREYCQRCEYFSAPPDVACANAGTDIVELVDGGRFRVRNCPKVAAGDESFSTRLDEE